MRKRSKKRISLFYNRITLFFLLIAVGFLSITVFELLGKEREAAQKRAEATYEYQTTLERQKVLEEDLRILDTPRGQEALVRSTFDVGKEGEEVIVVLDALSATTTEEEVRKGFFSWFVSLFE
tara:strand:+ start:292 stop:660 length:369 start_codon:yes stop_codon:yes gene_type:complete